MNEIEQSIRELVNTSDYQKGLEYDEDYLKFVGVTNVSDKRRLQFLVESESSYRKYLVQVETQFDEVVSTYCTCPQFQATHSCKHLAACLISFSNEIFPLIKPKDTVQLTKAIFQKIGKELALDSGVKKEVRVIPYLSIRRGYYYQEVLLKVKIGVDKMYSLLGKYNSFKRAVVNEEAYKFGTNFTYEPNQHYFSHQTKQFFQLIDHISLRSYMNGNAVHLDDESLKSLLQLFAEGVYLDDEKTFLPIKNGFPIPLKLSKEGHSYHLKFQTTLEDLEFLTDDLEYIYFGRCIYHLNSHQRSLLYECLSNRVDELAFDEGDFADFQKSVFRVVKNNIQLDESTKDIVIVTKPEVKFYFDLNESDITCIPKFYYQDQELSYFEDYPNVVRDVDYETEVCSLLYPYGFHKMNHLFLLDDFEAMCDFMDGGLDAISEKYPVFTSENLKNTKIVKQSSVATHFTIGKDQILHYDFDLGDIQNDELDGILSSLKKKKKYYRLKSGDILSLEQESLQELGELTEDLELPSTDLVNGHGVIPKYRALYLDMLKESKYDIIQTDSFFQEFIDQFKTYQNVELQFTDQELKTLRDYQVNGVKWLYTICKCGFGGILADEMGLGKSLQTIVFLRKLLAEDASCRFLIVCPTSLVYNWENEFCKFGTDMSYQVLAGSRIERRNLLNKFEGNVYITSYGLLREDLEIYQKMNFRVCVIDEAQNIKNPKTGLAQAVKSITAETKLALTGTPIENAITELWSIFDFIMPGFLSTLVHFQQKYKVKDFDEQTNQLLNSLKVQVKPFILRRRKQDVVKDLPAKIENNIFIDLNEEQKKYYAAEVKDANEKMTKLVEQGGFAKNKMIILALLTRLRQICIDPAIVFEDYTGGSAKIEQLISTIQEVVGNGHKILLFTSFKTALNIVKKALDEGNISNYVIAGDVPSRQRQMLVDAFNKDDTSVFLIMLKSGGTGLNLTSADVVIHLDLWWNPQAENQATDRTHRIGQTKTVEVIKLICRGTIEEKILDLQQKKKLLADKMIDDDLGDTAYFKSLSEQDIRDLLTYENKD